SLAEIPFTKQENVLNPPQRTSTCKNCPLQIAAETNIRGTYGYSCRSIYRKIAAGRISIFAVLYGCHKSHLKIESTKKSAITIMRLDRRLCITHLKSSNGARPSLLYTFQMLSDQRIFLIFLRILIGMVKVADNRFDHCIDWDGKQHAEKACDTAGSQDNCNDR